MHFIKGSRKPFEKLYLELLITENNKCTSSLHIEENCHLGWFAQQ